MGQSGGGDVGVARIVTGRWGWALWWPLVPWLLDALTVATFRPGAVTEPSAVLGAGSLVAVAILWFRRAPAAIRSGFLRAQVLGVTAVATLGGYVVVHVAGAAARVLEATLAGNEQARVFITTFGKPVDHTVWFGVAEQIAVAGLVLVVVIALAGWVRCMAINVPAEGERVLAAAAPDEARGA